jgi:phosphatidate cytidylyltransferase
MDDETTGDRTESEVDIEIEPNLGTTGFRPGGSRVRIIGAEQAGSVIPPKGFAVTEDPLGSEVPGEDPGEPESLDLRWSPSRRLSAPAQSPDTELPHWTDPPTGQVPAVLARDSDEVPEWQRDGDTGPIWREREHDWDDAVYEPSMLADEETNVGELRQDDHDQAEERRPWDFSDDDEGDAWPADERSDETDGSEVGEVPLVGHVTTISSSVRRSAVPTRSPVRQRHGRRRQPERVEFSSEPYATQAQMHSPAQSAGTARAPAQEAPHDGGSGRNMPIAIATGVAIAAVTLLAWWSGTVATEILATVVIALCAAEAYGTFRRAGRRSATILGIVAVAGLMISAYLKGPSAELVITALLIVGTLVWYLFGVEHGSPVEGISHTVFVYAWVGILGSFAALLLAPTQFPQRHGIAFFAGAIIAAVLDDIGSLAVGRWFGRHLLAPLVSPKKTWEGLIGGSALAILGSVLITARIHPWTTSKAALLGVVVAVVAPLGDLCESLIKRELKLKDMGSLVPGHGGMLDRFDALLFVMPATYFLVRLVHLG